MKHRIIIVPVLVFAVLVCWAMASPIGSSPDDNFHLSSIWCAEGDKEGVCRLYQNGEIAAVPSLVNRASDCFKRKAYQSAACQKVHPQVSSKTDAVTDHFNKGLYPKFYFKVMHKLSGENILFATFKMRLLNILLFCSLFTLIFVLSDTRLRNSLAWSWLITSVPLSMFLIASNNPSAWTIIGIGCLLVSLLGCMQSHGRTKLFFMVATVVCCALALGSRADGAVFVVVTLVVASILEMRKRPTLTDFDFYFFVAIAIAATLTFFTSTQGQFVVEHGVGVVDGNRDPLSVLWYNIARLPVLWFGGLGIQPLGWMDTPMPSAVFVGSLTVFLLVVSANLNGMWTRKKMAVLFIALIITAFPVWVLMQSLNLIPENVQARYLLPLLCLLVGVIALQEKGRQVIFKRATRLTIISLLSISHSLALYANIRRYVTGLDVFDWSLNTNMEWWDWPLLSPMALWGIASLTFLLMSYILVEYISAQPNKAPALT